MNPELYQRSKSIFLEVCDLPRGEWPQALQRLCGDDAALRARVEQLLQHHTEDSSGSGAPVAVHRLEPEATATLAASASEGTRDLAPGTVIAERYRIVTLLGRGGMGEVYRADDLTLNQPVALKFLPATVAAHPAWLARLRKEVRVAREITHRNICRVHDIVESETDCFITMAYVDGEDLRSLLKRIGRLPPDKALDVARQLCAGLAAAHARGIIHRDLKPANIMLDSRGQAIIMDFGLAGLVQEVKRAEIAAGTIGYMAPEQMAGIAVSVRSDLYALGLVLYELFTGVPALGPANWGRGRREASLVLARPCTIVPDIDPVVERVILQCLETDPHQRPASAMAIYAALPGGDPISAALAAGLVPAPEAVASGGATRHIHSTAAMVSLAGVLVMLGVAVWLSPHVHPVGRAGLEKSPRVMAAKADELLRELGQQTPVRDEAYGLSERLGCVFLKSPNAAGLDYATGPVSPLVFWNRTSPDHLVPDSIENVVFGAAQVTPSDPLPAEAGMAGVTLDSRGRLLGVWMVPSPLDSPSPEPEWSQIIARAGLDPATLTPTRPMTIPRIEADHRIAWLGHHPDDLTRPIRVEAATSDGRLVSFAVLSGAPDVQWNAWFDPLRRKTFVQNIRSILIALLVIAAMPLIRHHTRLRQSDLRGAIRLAGFVFSLRLLTWLLQAHHVPALTAELALLKAAVAGALTEAAVVWVFYMALEPLLRRFWPETLIAWNRLVAGRFRDPLVGSSVLLGALMGVSWVLLMDFDSLLTPWLGLTPRQVLRPEDFFSALMSSRQAVAFCVDMLRKAIYESLLLLLVLVGLRALLRRSLPASILGGILIALLFVPRASHPAVSWVLIGLGAVAPAIYVLTRYGLVPVIVSFFLAGVLLRFPLKLDPHAWYADSSLFALLVTTAVAAYGFALARRGTSSAA